MSVILPNAQLTVAVRAHPWGRDARGLPVPTSDDQVVPRGPYPGGVKEQPDGSYVLRLDPRMWPVRAGDRITADDGRAWVAAPDPKLHTNVVSPVLDHITATGTLDPPRVP